MNKVPKKELKKSKTVSKKVKKGSKRRIATKLKQPKKYTTWEKSLRSNIKYKSQRPEKSRKIRRSTKPKKAKTVKKKMKSKKLKSSKLKAKRTKKKKKVKKRKTMNSSVISDLSSKAENNIQDKISSLRIQDQKLKNMPLQAEKAFNFVYQGRPIEQDIKSESYKPVPNPFQVKPMRLPANSGQFTNKNIFGNSKISKLNNGK